MLLPHYTPRKKNYTTQRVDVPQSHSERLKKKKKPLALVGIITLECLARNVVPSPSIMFGFIAASVVWTKVKAERLQHCYQATCYRSVSEKVPQEHGEERITLWPYGQGTPLFYSLPRSMELVGSITTEHIYASSLSNTTALKFMKIIFPYPSLFPKLWLCMIRRKNTWLTLCSDDRASSISKWRYDDQLNAAS
jgi:hypothetical protein